MKWKIRGDFYFRDADAQKTQKKSWVKLGLIGFIPFGIYLEKRVLFHKYWSFYFMAIKSILFAQGPSFPRLVVSADIFCPKPAKSFFRLKNSAKSSLQNHQSRIWNGKVEVQASDLDLFWRWFQSYCLLTYHREWSLDFCKTRRIIHNARQKKKITGGVKYFDRLNLQQCAWLCTISSSHLSILMCIHSKLLFTGNKPKICLVISGLKITTLLHLLQRIVIDVIGGSNTKSQYEKGTRFLWDSTYGVNGWEKGATIRGGLLLSFPWLLPYVLGWNSAT